MIEKRKIAYYYIKQNNNDNTGSFKGIKALIQYITGKTLIDRKFDLADQEKFLFLSNATIINDSNTITVIFKSARHNYRAPLLSRNDLSVRENPKYIYEGEQVKTHIVIKCLDNNILLLLESGRQTLSIKTVLEYFNENVIKHDTEKTLENEEGHRPADEGMLLGSFVASFIPRDDFEQVLDSMDRVISIDVLTTKQIMGSESLNYSNRLNEVNENVKITLTARRNRSMKETAKDFLLAMAGVHREIQSIKVKGKLPDGEDSIIDTSTIVRKDLIEADRSEDTGEFVSDSVFDGMKSLARNFK